MKKKFTKWSMAIAFLAMTLLLPLEATAKTLYLDAGGSSKWDQGGAWFSAWVWGSSKADAWYRATKGDVYYEIEVPDDATGMKWLRFSSVSTSESWTQADGDKNGYWNQTGDLTIGSDNLLTIKGWGTTLGTDYAWSTYEAPAPAPVITIGAIPEIANTTVGETATATLTYTLKNADKADVTIEGEGFAAVDNDGTITITFTPEEAGEYTATITITAGEVKETATITAIAIAPETPKVPEILNVTGPVFEQTVVGESSTATVTYEVFNFDDTPSVRVEGEGFVIAGEDEGSVNIMFEPQGAGEFNGTLTITAGEVEKLVPFSAIAVEPTPVVTIKVATPANWESCYIWAWTASGNLYDSFPGAEMTKGDDGFYFIDIETAEAISFLVSDNGEETKKTADYSDGVTESTCFDIDNNALVINSSCEYQDIPEPEPIEPYVAIRGTMTDWNIANDIKMTYNADAANGPEWYITAFEVPADGKFKVVSVDAQSKATWYGSDKVDLQEGITNAGEGDGDIALPAGKYDIYFKVNEGRMWIQKYVEPTPEPEPLPIVITITDDVEFPLTYPDQVTNDIVGYTIENAPVDAEVGVELTGDEAFSIAEVQDGFIFLAFAPMAEGEYNGTLTITVGEVSETLEFSAVASPVEPGPEPAELEFALVGRLNGDNDNEILAFEDGYKFTQESEFVYTLNVTFTGTITSGDKEIQKVKLVDAEGNIWARNSSKTIKPGDGTSTMTKGETTSSTYLQCEAGVEYKITYTLVSDPAEALYKLSGQLTFEKVEAPVEPEPEPEPEPDPEPTTITLSLAVNGWDVAYIYAFNPEGELTGTWPGEEMTAEEGKFTYEFTLPEGDYNFIFSNDAGTQTTDTEGVFESTCYVLDTSVSGKWELAISAECEAVDPKPIETTYVLMGVGGDWTTGIELDPNPENDDEYMLLNQSITTGDAVKVVIFSEEGTTYCGNVKDGSAEFTYDDMGNIVLAEGTYDFYYSISANAFYVALKEGPDVPTDVEDAVSELIYAVDGTIIAPAPFAIIDLSGKDVTNANGALEGAYIVKTQNSVTKVLVK